MKLPNITPAENSPNKKKLKIKSNQTEIQFNQTKEKSKVNQSILLIILGPLLPTRSKIQPRILPPLRPIQRIPPIRPQSASRPILVLLPTSEPFGPSILLVFLLHLSARVRSWGRCGWRVGGDC